MTQRGGDLGELRERLAGRTSVLVGHSGVGKSTLVNALVPGADRDVGVVNAVTGRGRHTSTSALMLALPAAEGRRPRLDHRHPGIRSFGLAHVRPAGPDRARSPTSTRCTEDCPRGCTHGADEPECGLDAWVAAGQAGPAGRPGWSRCAGCCAPARRQPED